VAFVSGLMESGGLVEDEAEQAIIRRIRELRAGGAALRAIQGKLEVQHGRRLSLDALHRVVSGRT
jgi:hypothetical protein